MRALGSLMDVSNEHELLETDHAERTFTAPAVSPGVTFLHLIVRPRDRARERARLAIVHGYGDHAGRYLEFMQWLAARGIGCHAVDLRGHGRSSGRRAYVERWDEYLDDLDAFLSQDELRADAPPVRSGTEVPLPVFLLGHSHGGLVVATAGIRHRLDPHHLRGVVLSAPYLINKLRVPRHKVVAAHVINLVAPWLRIRSGVRPDMMSSDQDIVEQSNHDPLLLRAATPRWYLTHRPVQAEVLRHAADMTLPLLVLQGDADPIADPAGARAFHERAGTADKQLISYPGFRHEPLRETDRQRVFADILAWLDQRAP
jgi:lysophospholipase